MDAEALIKSMHGLGYYSNGNILVPALIYAAIKWLQLVQNTDGGFGEVLDIQKDLTVAGHGKSTAPLTAQGAIASLDYL